MANGIHQDPATVEQFNLAEAMEEGFIKRWKPFNDACAEYVEKTKSYDSEE